MTFKASRFCPLPSPPGTGVAPGTPHSSHIPYLYPKHLSQHPVSQLPSLPGGSTRPLRGYSAKSPFPVSSTPPLTPPPRSQGTLCGHMPAPALPPPHGICVSGCRLSSGLSIFEVPGNIDVCRMHDHQSPPDPTHRPLELKWQPWLFPGTAEGVHTRNSSGPPWWQLSTLCLENTP